MGGWLHPTHLGVVAARFQEVGGAVFASLAAPRALTVLLDRPAGTAAADPPIRTRREGQEQHRACEWPPGAHPPTAHVREIDSGVLLRGQ